MGVFQIVALEPSPKWRGQGEVIKKRQFEMHPQIQPSSPTLLLFLLSYLMSINEIQNEIIEEFELFDEWEDRYAHLIELGKKLPHMAEELKTDERKVKGCQSSVWLYPTLENNQIIFQADSDAMIVKGLVSLLVRTLSCQTPEAIAQSDLYMFEKIGMTQHLSMTRANGLASMIKQMKMYALALQ
jgi:cysteine desulfuration protein SufE